MMLKIGHFEKNRILSVMALAVFIFSGSAASAQIELSIEEIPGFNYNSDEEYYVNVSLSPSGDQMIITRYVGKGKEARIELAESVKIDSVWSKPRPLTLINQVKGKMDWQTVSSFSRDGKTICFSANFQDSYGGDDIYSSNLIDGVWQSPVNLGQPINSKGTEVGASITPNNQRMYFTSGVEESIRVFYSEKDLSGDWKPRKIWFENLRFEHTEQPIAFRDNAMLFYAMEEKTSDHAIYLSVLRSENEWTVPLEITFNKEEITKRNNAWNVIRYVTTTKNFDYLYITSDGNIYRSKVTLEMKSMVDNAYVPSRTTVDLPTKTIEKKSTTGDIGGENRTALVIGNADYRESKLRNPVNDARSITEELKKAGFTVITHTDASLGSMKEAVRSFGDRLKKNPGVGLFYFAGHGIQSNGINYLVPSDANIERQYDIEDECMRADRVLRMMELYGNPMNIIVLDACRNNPYTTKFRSLNRGLAQPELAPTGSIIAFATAPGKTASDGEGDNGLYTQELIKAMQTRGLKIEEIFKQARINVRDLSNGKQNPWENSSLIGDFYFYK